MFTHHVLAKSKPGQSAAYGCAPSFPFSPHSLNRSTSRGALMQ
jgi:hypothetical protein